MAMMTKPFSLPEAMQPYLLARNTQPDAVQQSLIDIAASMPAGGMKTSTEAATMLTVLVAAIQPKFVVEVGTFIGYSSLAMATALPVDGGLLCLDVSEEWTAVARDHWAQAGVANKIELVIAPASETLAALPADPPIDFAFVDADKGGYAEYYELILDRLSPNGMIAVDNTIWSARVIDDSDQSEDTVALRDFNDMVAADDRTTNVTIPIGDGVTLITLR